MVRLIVKIGYELVVAIHSFSDLNSPTSRSNRCFRNANSDSHAGKGQYLKNKEFKIVYSLAYLGAESAFYCYFQIFRCLT